MANRVEIFDDDLANVNGGRITYTWDGTVGTIGLNGNNAFILLDKNAFVSYYNSVKDTATDAEVLTALMQKGIIKKK